MRKPIQVEVCANSLFSAFEAEKGGAFRVELCENIPEGGTTPSAGTICLARKKLSIRLHVIIRPRGGDFCYSEEEYEIMQRDILFCKEHGVDGVVFGLLDPEGKVDRERNQQLLDLARPMSCTFHRAFDVTRDGREALEDLIAMGFDTVLTSGEQVKAVDGVSLIAQRVEQAQGRIEIMPGSGINAENIRWMAEKTGATTFHLSARRPYPSRMVFRTQLPMGSLSADEEWNRRYTDAALVERVLRAANG
ncbi:MAG: copper homeostasis protein CutC [Bacteroidetes bacterium]|nr:MAG: copper homeostasis protein CutC [Bacteroidota bacterium]PIE88525.1 MAG: copper homeostasis protein CutC [Bacteroidota bacterium]